MKIKKSLVAMLLAVAVAAPALADVSTWRLEPTFNKLTGAMDSLKISGDKHAMPWLLRTDGTQYAWIGNNYGWGLGYMTVGTESKVETFNWRIPTEKSADGMSATYRAGGMKVCVSRRFDGSDLVETYTLKNEGDETATLNDIGIYTPLNDNYPDARTCMTQRTDVQVWDGGSAAYINALRMGAEAPHLGLVVTRGAVSHYEIWERGREKMNSQTRGVIALCLPDMTLRPGECYTVEWRLFAHEGDADFRKKLLERGGVLVSADRYVLEQGDTARVKLMACRRLNHVEALLNGVPVTLKDNGDGSYTVEQRVTEPGEFRLTFRYDGNRATHADLLVLTDIERLIGRRTDFIRTRQQMSDRQDGRYGAYMVYDNEGDSIYLNDTRNCNPPDRDEGAERTGMGILLAKQYLITGDPLLKESLVRYAEFFRNKLQTADFKTFSSIDRNGRNRGYNYMWAADFYFLMYDVTGEKKFAEYGYRTLRSMYDQFGHGFYAIGIPVSRGLHTLEKAGMRKEREALLRDFTLTGDAFIKNGLDYPAHEVNYEQSIVAPAVWFLLEMYAETGQRKYLDEARRQLPVLEAFGGFQPSFHLNDISIRHWDGHWFGKREMFGDTFPHYWSAITAAVYHLWAEATGDTAYQKRAENIVRNNLCLFTEDGRASCAYLYPNRINGVRAAFYDPYANDQDWALVFYLMVCKGI